MNELRQILGDTVTRLFTDLVSKELLESAEQGQWPAGLWQALEENGLTLPLVPEAQGGAGGTSGDAFVIVRAAGHHAVPVPLAETIVASWLLSAAGLEIPLGPLTLAPVESTPRLRLVPGTAGLTLTGEAARVPWGRAARHLVVVAPGDDGTATVALVDPGAARIAPGHNLALEPRDTLTFAGAPVIAAGHVSAGPVRVHGAMVRAAQLAGALEAALDQSVRYAGERKQFGRAIGAFQAIQHQLALLAGHAATAASASASAFRAAEKGADPWFETAVAKIRAGEAAGLGAAIAHQVHGAIGFTYEHSLHFLTRRLWSWRAEFGGEPRWAEALGRFVAARGADGLWPHVTSR